MRVVLLLSLIALPLLPSAVSAHHAADRLSAPSPKCGWTEGDSLRDRSNLTEFCARWVPGELRIASAAADRERLSIEAPRELALVLKTDDRSTSALLREWLRAWRQISGFPTVEVRLLREHVEIAKAYTTMAGDVVTLR
jgi:hypothetical protein